MINTGGPGRTWARPHRPRRLDNRIHPPAGQPSTSCAAAWCGPSSAATLLGMDPALARLLAPGAGAGRSADIRRALGDRRFRQVMAFEMLDRLTGRVVGVDAIPTATADRIRRAEVQLGRPVIGCHRHGGRDPGVPGAARDRAPSDHMGRLVPTSAGRNCSAPGTAAITGRRARWCAGHRSRGYRNRPRADGTGDRRPGCARCRVAGRGSASRSGGGGRPRRPSARSDQGA